MTTTQVPVSDAAPRIARPAAPTPRKARPVLWFAALGAVFMAIVVYVFARYLLDLPENVPSGPTKVPGYMLWNIRIHEIYTPILGIFLLTKFIFRPLLRKKRVHWDGLALLAIMTVMWQNWGINWFAWHSGYNAALINRGSWYGFAPFWSAPNADRYVESLLFTPGFYASWIVLSIWFCWWMRWAKRRWPQMGNVGVLGIGLAMGMAFDFAAEILWMRGGMWHYGGAPRGPWLLFEGHFYQYPLYEMVLFGACMGLFAAVRYFKNDRGESIVERGIEDVNVSQRTKTGIRFLALVGIFNLIYLCFNISEIPIGMHQNRWPEDIQKRSYFTQYICGPKTDRACPGPGVPHPRNGSYYLTPDGKAAHDSDWSGPPPAQVPFAE